MVNLLATAIYDGTNLEIKVRLEDPQYSGPVLSLGIPKDKLGDYVITVEVEGKTQTLTGTFSKIALRSFNFVVSNKKTIDYLVLANGTTHSWQRFANTLRVLNHPFSLTLNETVDNLNPLVDPNPPGMNPASNIKATSYTLSWEPPFSGSSTIKDYILSVKDITNNKFIIPSTSIGNVTSFDVIAATPDTSFIASVIARNEENLTSLESNVISFKTLAVEILPPIDPVPITNMIAQVILNPKLENDLVTGNVELTTTNTFDPFFFNKTQTHFIQLKNISNVVIDLVQTDVVFSAQNQTKTVPFSISAQGLKSIIIETFLLDSQKRAFSQILSKQVDEISLPVDIQMSVTDIEYRRLSEGATQGFVKSQLGIISNQDAIGLDVKYVMSILDRNTGESLTIKERFVTINGTTDGRSMNEVIPDFDQHQQLTITWFVVNVATSEDLDSFAQDVDAFVEPPPQKLNTSFTVSFFDGTVQSFILTDEDFALLITQLPSDDPNFFISTGVDTDLPALEIGTVIQAIEDKLATAPKVPDPNSFSQDFTVVEYKSTELGKSLFAQIQVTKLIDPPESLINSFLQVLTQGKKAITLEFQEISVAGVNKFAIVYEIPDLIGTTATIFVQHFLQTKEGLALSDVIEVTRTIDIPVKPAPEIGDNFFSKIVGIWAGMTAGALMLARGRN